MPENHIFVPFDIHSRTYPFSLYLGTPLLPPFPRAMKLFFFIFGDLLHTNVSSLFSYVIQASNKWFDFIEQWSWSSLVLRRSRLGQTWTTSPRETRRERLANIANTEILNTERFKRLCIAIDHDIIPFTLLHKRCKESSTSHSDSHSESTKNTSSTKYVWERNSNRKQRRAK